MEAHRLRGAVRVAILQGGEDLRVMRAILSPAIFRERLALELDPGVPVADDLQDIVHADQKLVSRGGKYPRMELRVPVLELAVVMSLGAAMVRVGNR